MKFKIIRTNSKNQDFKNLVNKLDAFLKITDGNEHSFYNQFNNIDVLQHVVVLYVDDKKSSSQIAVGCGAIKKIDIEPDLIQTINAVEVKRMFVLKNQRGKGYAKQILGEIEIWAKELGYNNCILETGKRQIAAVQFYKKMGYKVISNYGQYKNMANSICFIKTV